MVDRSELVLGQHVVVRLCGGETVGAVVDGLCNDWVGVRPDRGGYVIADWEDIEVVRTVLAVKNELPLMDGDADLYFDEWNQQKQNPTKRQCFDEGIRYAQRLKKEQKPAWSEEDEDMFVSVLHFLNTNRINERGKVITWVKSLPERFSLQPKAEWSEEDKLTVDSAIFWLKRRLLSEKAEDISTDSCRISMRKTIERLESLRPSWKPSEEQMRALNKVVNGEVLLITQHESLESLYEQLKKL